MDPTNRVGSTLTISIQYTNLPSELHRMHFQSRSWYVNTAFLRTRCYLLPKIMKALTSHPSSATFFDPHQPYVCMLFQSFVMHYNAPRFYTELKHPTISHFSQVVGYSFGIASTISIVIASAGFLTFGGAYFFFDETGI